MEPFEAISHRGQLRRLRRCAPSVLYCYGIRAPRLKLLAHHQQTTFKVISDGGRKSFVLRFERASHRSPDTIRSQFAWLRFLKANSSVVAPLPVRTLAGKEVLAAANSELPADLHCSMTTWVNGKRYFRKRGPGARVLKEVGRLMGTMHALAETFPKSDKLALPRWDWNSLFGAPSREVKRAERQKLNPQGRRLFERAIRKLERAMSALGQGRDTFGIIHGDVIQSNYLIDKRQVNIIDFADLCFSYFLYDIGTTLFALWGLDEDQQQRRAFISGYREVRQLSDGEEMLIDLFTAARGIVLARRVITSDHPSDIRIADRYLARVVEGLQQWVRHG